MTMLLCLYPERLLVGDTFLGHQWLMIVFNMIQKKKKKHIAEHENELYTAMFVHR